MGVTLTAKEKPLLDIFNNHYVFRIPSYQRPYSWTVAQAEALFGDVLDALRDAGGKATEAPAYFLGSIVLIKKMTSPRPMWSIASSV